ncbi:MAG: M23 family metallopeptidase, partial [Deltaproteobacteria bacterium]|nr:M23 family metallopeptidase [Deltaproteobacteria bacterium]
VVAAQAGTVRFAGWRRGYGVTIELDHGFGWHSRYAHLRAAVVRRGAAVGAGELIGRVGATGLVTGPHLHFELHYAGQPLDPLPFLRAGLSDKSRFDAMMAARLK